MRPNIWPQCRKKESRRVLASLESPSGPVLSRHGQFSIFLCEMHNHPLSPLYSALTQKRGEGGPPISRPLAAIAHDFFVTPACPGTASSRRCPAHRASLARDWG